MLKRITLIFVVILFIPFLFILSSCKEEVKSIVNYSYDPNVVPIVNTDSVSAFISDSGIIKYKVLTKTWKMYDGEKNESWYFPEGMYLEQFDTLFNVIMSVKADTAWNYTDTKIWKLKGNVFIEKHETLETYSSPEFYWDQQKRIVYSDSVVTIDSPDGGLINASKFYADDRLTNIVFVSLGELSSRGKGVIYVNEDKVDNDENNEEVEE